MITLLGKYSHLMARSQHDEVIYSVPTNSSNSRNPQVGEYSGNDTVPRRKPGFQHGQLIDYCITRDGTVLKTLQDGILNSLKKYGKYKFLFQRNNEGVYEGATYQESIEQAKNVGAGIINLELAPEVNEYKDMKLKMVGVHSINRKEWAILDMAAILYGITMVPLYDTLGEDSLSYCLNHSGIYSMFASSKSIDILLKTQDLGRIKFLISFDKPTDEQKNMAQQRNLQILDFQTVIQSGIQKPHELPKISPDHCFTFSYTSGTTGVPKCAMMSHKNFVSMVMCINNVMRKEDQFAPGDRHLSYLPLPHVMERLIFINNLFSGCEIYYFSGDIQKLKQDIQDVKPTGFPSVPRLFLRFYDALVDGIKKLEGTKKSLFEMAFAAKQENMNKSCYYSHALWDRLIFKKTKQAFGGKVKWMITGSAPISGEALQFLKVVAACPIYEAYGQTESTGGSFCTDANDPTSGHVGGPTSSTEFKLQSVKELDYQVSDTQNGKHTPRGEVCIRGPTVFLGYYKDEEKTKEAIDEDGWLHTGDVGMILPNGSLKIIDRKKNIFKLSQGEYVAPEKIENVYKQATGVAEIFVHGNSLENYLVALIVPSPEYAQKFADENNISDSSIESLCQNKQFYDQILSNMETQAKKDKLMGFEKVKKVILEPVSLQVHGCLTNTFKLQRTQAIKIFKEQLEQLYKQ